MLSAGTQDPDFGAVSTDFHHFDKGGILVRLADGKLLQAGSTIEDNPPENSGLSFALARFNADGTPDNSFGPDAGNTAIVALPNPDDFKLIEVSGAAVDQTGRIVVVGTVANFLESGAEDWIVAAFTSDGQLDTSFGTDGIGATDGAGVVVTDFTAPSGNNNDVARAVLVDAGNNIVVAGIVTPTGAPGPQFAVARYTSTGALDTANFGGGDGFAYSATSSNSYDDLHAMAIQPDGKIVLGGFSFEDVNASELIATFAVQRYTSAGVLDVGFGNNPDSATARTQFSDHASISALEIDTTGGVPTILAGGAVGIELFPSFAMVRYDLDGNPISGFGSSGMATYRSAADDAAVITDLQVQNDGMILAGGDVGRCSDDMCSQTNTALSIARFSPSGDTDFTFGANGVSYGAFSPGSMDEHPATIVIQPETNHVVLSGTTRKRDALTSQVRSGNIVTATSATPHGFSTATTTIIEIKDAQPASFNGVFEITVVDPTTFTYASTGPNEPATVAGTYRDNDDFVMTRYSLVDDAGNVPPTAEINGAPASSAEGTAIHLTSTVTDPDSSSFTYAWSVTKNGSPFGSGSASDFTFTPNDNETYIVTLTVTDDADGQGSDIASIDVTNVPPNITISGAASVNEGSSYSLTLGAVSDPGDDTVSSYIVHWGDGNTNTYSSNGIKTHTYADGPANRAITVDLVDEDGTFSNRANALSVTVNNVAPTAQINGAPASSPEGTGISLTSTVTDPGADGATYAWSVTKNGNPFASGGLANFSFTPNDNGTYIVSLLVTDDDGATGNAAPKTINVTNVNPTVAAISGPSSGIRSFEQTFSSSFSDPGAADSWTVSWNFGDGNSVSSSGSPGALSTTHTYVVSGTYTVTLTVLDDDGGSQSKTTSITISDSGVVGGTGQVGGSAGSNDIRVNLDGSVTIDGHTSPMTGASYVVVKAGGGNDTVKVNPNYTGTVIVFGGPGDDSIKGGAGDDILIGGDGADLIQGAEGRDILIGGKGADRIIGNAGDDIIVAGYSSYDSNVQALRAIQSEWVMDCNSSRCNYGQRSADVLNQDVTINGNTYHTAPTFDEDPIGFLHRNNGNFFLTPDGANATVFDDGDQDVMTGNQGQDLFLFNAGGPVSDTITDLSATEFAADIDFINNP